MLNKMSDQKPKSSPTKKVSGATISKLLGLGSVLCSVLILSYAAYISVQALQAPPTPAAVASAAPKLPTGMPTLQLNVLHQRQGTVVTAPVAPSGRSDPFLP